MITAANLKTQTVKDLSQMAKQMGLPGWHTMRKDQLVRALVRASKAKAAKATRKRATARTTKKKTTPTRRGVTTASKGKVRPAAKKTVRKKSSGSSVALRKMQRTNAQRERQKDLSRTLPKPKKTANARVKRRPRKKLVPGKDRIVLLVRDPYWLQACWEVTRHSVERARAAMAEHWHTARPVLRLFEVDSGSTTSTTERVVRDIEIHGGVKNWYIDVRDPPKSFRVDLGYLAENGKFQTLSRSNVVTSPSPGGADAIDENWTDVAENYEKIFALSGGYDDDQNGGELQELFEERLRRPMGSPVVTRFGDGADKIVNRHRDFEFEVDAEMIIYGSTKPDAHVSLANEPVKLRSDGSFTIRLSMPDRRQVLPVVACSSDGVEQRTIVLAIERNTKVMEPKIRESNQ